MSEALVMRPCEDPNLRPLVYAFKRTIRKGLTAKEIATVNERNATPDYDLVGACATHDFCDANMAMLEAWTSLQLPEWNAEEEYHAVLWNDAWDLAKSENFAI